MKKCQEASAALRRARNLYCTRQQEYARAKENVQRALMGDSNDALGKVDKRRKTEDEALQKVRLKILNRPPIKNFF